MSENRIWGPAGKPPGALFQPLCTPGGQADGCGFKASREGRGLPRGSLPPAAGLGAHEMLGFSFLCSSSFPENRRERNREGGVVEEGGAWGVGGTPPGWCCRHSRGAPTPEPPPRCSSHPHCPETLLCLSPPAFVSDTRYFCHFEIAISRWFECQKHMPDSSPAPTPTPPSGPGREKDRASVTTAGGRQTWTPVL